MTTINNIARMTLIAAALAVCGCSQKQGRLIDDGTVALSTRFSEPETGSFHPLDTVDFGTIDKGSIVRKRIDIANPTGKPLVVVQVTSGCGCTTTEYDSRPVLPDSSFRLTVQFDSKSKEGPQRNLIRVATNEGKIGAVVLMTGNVK